MLFGQLAALFGVGTGVHHAGLVKQRALVQQCLRGLHEHLYVASSHRIVLVVDVQYGHWEFVS